MFSVKICTIEVGLEHFPKSVFFICDRCVVDGDTYSVFFLNTALFLLRVLGGFA